MFQPSGQAIEPLPTYAPVEPPEGLITKVDGMYRISLRGEQVIVDFDIFECWWEYSRRFIESHRGAEHELRIKPFLDSLKAK
jgi:hypothetical protein